MQSIAIIPEVAQIVESKRTARVEESQVMMEIRRNALQAFDSALCEREREGLIEEFVKVEYPHGFLPPPGVIQSLAAARWFENQRKSA